MPKLAYGELVQMYYNDNLPKRVIIYQDRNLELLPEE